MRLLRRLPLLVALAACGGDPVGPAGEEAAPDPEVIPPPFVLTLPGDSTLAVAPNELAYLVVRVERTPEFTEVLTFSALAPEGFVVIFRPTEVVREETDLLLVAGAGVAPGAHHVTIRATAAGGAIQSAPLHVVVGDPAS